MVQLDERSVYTTAETAKILKLSRVTIERQIRRGELKAIRLGKEYRLLGRDLLALFDWRAYAESSFATLSRELRARYSSAAIVKQVISRVRRSQRR